MKKIIISSLILLVVSSIGYSQNHRKGLMGPEAKNYKPFKYDNSIPGLELEPQKRLTGPKAKNAKPWDEKEEVLFENKTFVADKPKLMGPKAKNYKPWLN